MINRLHPDYLSPNDGGCWFCELNGCDNFTFEWDSYVHEACVKLEAENGHLEAYIIYQEWERTFPEVVANWNVMLPPSLDSRYDDPYPEE